VETTFVGSTLCSTAFTSSNLTRADFTRADCIGTKFADSILTDAQFDLAVVKGADFSNSGLMKERLYETRSYIDKDMGAINLSRLNLQGVNFAAFSLGAARFDGADLTSANFERTVFTNTSFDGALIDAANFSRSNFSMELLKQTQNYHDKRLLKTDLSYLDFEDADFTGFTVEVVTFNHSNLQGVDFSGATLSGTSFNLANIKDANFSDSDLCARQFYESYNYQNNDLGRVNLSRVNLSGWKLCDRTLRECTFSGADLTGTNLENSDLRNSDLSSTIGQARIKNTIGADGVVRNADLDDKYGYLKIGRYEPLDAKIAEADVLIAANATLTLAAGARLDITDGKALTLSSTGNLVFEFDSEIAPLPNACVGQIHVSAQAGFALENGFTLIVNDAFHPQSVITVELIKSDEGALFRYLGLTKDKITILRENGETYEGDWDLILDDSGLSIVFAHMPEPAASTLLLGLLCLARRARRR